MTNPNAIALLLVRFLGLIALLLGVIWIAYVVAAFCLLASGAPQWITTGVWQYMPYALSCGPIWLLAGIALLRFSPRLARFVAKGVEGQAGS